ncbi:hypothetical protein LJC61_05295 [Ruminococcaceae bacterium OttesenSCG-928-A16]|nr:hypothetical protein [Ruminococcaceae bacterium OttesenSCG-928-A16]
MKKPLGCPACGSRIIDADTGAVTVTRVVSKNEISSPGHWEPDYILKCWKCGQHIGLKHIGHKMATEHQLILG